jgi:protein-glutamine gamma-glutamyltransferase
MGGVPAEVAAGFTPGSLDKKIHKWTVSDTDAHAWVEAWFPSYGWVRFDPTPPSAAPTPAASSISQSHNGGFNGSRTITRHGLNATGVDPTKLTLQSGKSVPVWLAVVAVLALLAAVGFLLRFRRRREGIEEEELIDELERALRRTGRSVDTPVTLAVLEDRFGSSGAGGAYIRSIRLARYGGQSSAPTREQRRAFRSELAAGLGLGGRLRALWALPPRR